MLQQPAVKHLARKLTHHQDQAQVIFEPYITIAIAKQVSTSASTELKAPSSHVADK